MSKGKHKRGYLLLLNMAFLGVLAGGCATLRNASLSDTVPQPYREQYAEQHLAYRWCHLNGEYTRLFVQIPSNLLATSDSSYLHIELFADERSERLVWQIDTLLRCTFGVADSGSRAFKIPLSVNFLVPLTERTINHLHLAFWQKGRIKARHSAVLRKTSRASADNFFIANAQQQVLFHSFAPVNTPLNIHYRQQQPDSLLVDYYQPLQQLALPVYIEEKRPFLPDKPDSIFVVHRGHFIPQKTGTYRFRLTDDQFGEGFTVLCTDADFPRLTSSEDLAEVLRYITRRAEFDGIWKSSKRKTAVDSFWLDRSGSFERGRQLIKIFYGRVERANRFFSSYKEGWKTDRGLVYIIYGLPDHIDQDLYGETWIYGYGAVEDGGTRFRFNETVLPFGKDFLLQRSPNYEPSWHDAVHRWRSGVVVR